MGVNTTRSLPEPPLSMKLARLPDGSPEIFFTLQGEGISQGAPAIFVRASLCNLHCRWCDTDFTWNWEGTPWPHDHDQDQGYAKYRKEDHLIDLDPSEIAERIHNLQANCQRLVLTGGEPLLQQEELIALLDELAAKSDESWTVEVETNGTLTPLPALAERVSQFNVSPKLENSGNAESLRLTEDALRAFNGLPNTWFKFVISTPSDLLDVQELEKRCKIASSRILLMPEGRTKSDLQNRQSWLVDACLERGYRYSGRLHVDLWGDQRGR